LLHHHLGGGPLLSYQPVVMIVTLVLSLLMVSRIHYHTFKKVRLRARSIPWVVISASLVLVAAYFTSFSFIFVMVCLVFICSGLAEELVRFARRHSPRHLPSVHEKEDK
jgi:phosphatidylserine synthase